MSDKLQYARRARDMAAIFSKLSDDILSLQNVYFDRGYNDGGADELIDTFLVANRGYLSQMRNDL